MLKEYVLRGETSAKILQCKDPSMWNFIDMKHLVNDGYFATMCRHAVDRSQGQLVKLHIDRFATERLLAYISERSSKLRCLQFRNCYRVGDDSLIEAAKKFPLLEELHLVYVTNIHDFIEPIGQYCPKLKSFTLLLFDKRELLVYEDDDSTDDCNDNFEALAIAKSMPNLRHLRLVGNNMTNEGLQAILDGCPYPESLDIRGCFNIDLHAGIRDRIAQNIEDFKHPDDPMEHHDCDDGIFNFGGDSPSDLSFFDSPSDYYCINDESD